MKKTIFTISLLSLVVTTANAVDLSAQDQAKFNNAVKAYRANHNADALKLLTELYKDYPQNQQVKNNYAVTLFASGKIEQAEEVLSNVIENDNEVNVAFKNLNKIYDYAAAKAYSNALGTDKEVQPQKLQMIESVVFADTKPTEAVETKPVQLAENKGTPKAAAALEVTQKAIVKSDTKAIIDPIASEITQTPPMEKNVPTAKPANVPAVTAPVKSEATKAEPEITLEVANKVVQSWADAWSKGDVKAYAAFYTPTYAPEGMSHKNWLEGRKLRINPSKDIHIKFNDLVIVPNDKSDTVIVNFKQSYQANQYKDNTSKQLIWRKIGDKWLIEKEVSL